jgi:hypothetical protein
MLNRHHKNKTILLTDWAHTLAKLSTFPVSRQLYLTIRQPVVIRVKKL